MSEEQTGPRPRGALPYLGAKAAQGGDSHSQWCTVQKKTLQEKLAEHVGSFVVCEMLIGTQNRDQRSGWLIQVGPSYFELYDKGSDSAVSCDLYSLKYFTVPGVSGSYPEKLEPLAGGNEE